jgi:hypothetical protein
MDVEARWNVDAGSKQPVHKSPILVVSTHGLDFQQWLI